MIGGWKISDMTTIQSGSSLTMGMNLANTGLAIRPTLVFNMAAYKDFRIRKRLTLQFRREFFNVFNHTNFNGPSTNPGAGTFGQITGAKDPRTGELALKLRFQE